MVDPQRRDPARGEHVRAEHVGRIEATAEPDLDHAGICRFAREGEEGRSDGDFEEAGVQITACIQHLGQQRGEVSVFD